MLRYRARGLQKSSEKPRTSRVTLIVIWDITLIWDVTLKVRGSRVPPSLGSFRGFEAVLRVAARDAHGVQEKCQLGELAHLQGPPHLRTSTHRRPLPLL